MGDVKNCLASGKTSKSVTANRVPIAAATGRHQTMQGDLAQGDTECYSGKCKQGCNGRVQTNLVKSHYHTPYGILKGDTKP